MPASKTVTICIDDMVVMDSPPWAEIRNLMQALRKRRAIIILETDFMIEEFSMVLNKQHVLFDRFVRRMRSKEEE